MIYIGYITTIYLVISLAVASFLLITKRAYIKGFTKLRLARWILTIPLLMLEELISTKGK